MHYMLIIDEDEDEHWYYYHMHSTPMLTILEYVDGNHIALSHYIHSACFMTIPTIAPMILSHTK